MPYLANIPFSLAIIRGAASVKAINPSFAVVTSGASPPVVVAGLAWPSVPGVVGVGALPVVQPCNTTVPRAVAPAVKIKLRLVSLLIIGVALNSRLPIDFPLACGFSL